MKMTARELVIEILGNDENLYEHDLAKIFGGGVSYINHKNPKQSKIVLFNTESQSGENLACAIHESIHCKRAKEGVEIYRKHVQTWTARERHEEEYNVTLL